MGFQVFEFVDVGSGALFRLSLGIGPGGFWIEGYGLYASPDLALGRQQKQKP